MRGLVSRLMEAISAALRAVKLTWEFCRETGRMVARLVQGTPEPLPPIPEAVSDQPPVEDVAAGLKRWAAARAMGETPRLPRGIKPQEAEWAVRLLGAELEKVAKSSSSAIAAHIRGEQVINGVRPTLVVASSTPSLAAEERAAAREAKKAEMRAAMSRAAAADRRRRQEWAEKTGSDPFAGESAVFGKAL